jgi:hypothetical protein
MTYPISRGANLKGGPTTPFYLGYRANNVGNLSHLYLDALLCALVWHAEPIPIAHSLSRPLSYWPMWNLMDMPQGRCHHVLHSQKYQIKLKKQNFCTTCKITIPPPPNTLFHSISYWSQLCGPPLNRRIGHTWPSVPLGVKGDTLNGWWISWLLHGGLKISCYTLDTPTMIAWIIGRKVHYNSIFRRYKCYPSEYYSKSLEVNPCNLNRWEHRNWDLSLHMGSQVPHGSLTWQHFLEVRSGTYVGSWDKLKAILNYKHKCLRLFCIK